MWVKGAHYFMRYPQCQSDGNRSGGKVQLVLLAAVPVFAFFLALYFSVSNLTQSATPFLERLLVSVHISGATMGQLLAISSGGISYIFLWQNKRLKQKRWQPLGRHLPALELWGELLGASLWTGFIFLTLALFSGGLLIWFFPLLASHLPRSKILWASLVWGWYLVILYARARGNVTTLVTARLSLVGFCLLVLVFFGLSFLLWGETQ